MHIKDRIPLFIGLGLPILLLLYIFVSVYLPSILVKPQYNFLYASGCSTDYSISVINNRIVITSNYNGQYSVPYSSCIYLYDTRNDSNTPLSQQQALSYSNINPTNKSPDGFTVVSNSSGDTSYFPLFWYGEYNSGYYLLGHGYNKEITNDTYDFKFLGWVQ